MSKELGKNLKKLIKVFQQSKQDTVVVIGGMLINEV